MKKKKGKSQLKDLKKKLAGCEKLKAEYLANWQRFRADFLNYKKREMERISELSKYANEALILKILPILDNFDRAKKQMENIDYENARTKGMIEGFLQIERQLKDFLKNQGVEEIETEGKKFDPNFHEAVGQIESSEESGTIIEEIEKGYKLHGNVIRAAKVKVAK